MTLGRSGLVSYAIAACIAVVVAYADPIPSADHGPPRKLVFIVPLSRPRELADTNWTRITSPTTFRVSHTPTAESRLLEELPRDALVLQGSSGVAFVGIEHDRLGFCGGPLEMWTAATWHRPEDASSLGKLRSYSAHLWAVFYPSSATPAGRALACAELVHVLSQTRDAIGVMNFQAFHFTSVDLVKRFVVRDDPATHRGVFDLLVNVHAEEFDGETRISTIGMTQFALPEIELWIEGRAQARDTERVADAAHCGMVGGCKFRVGERLLLPPENTRYRIAAPRQTPESSHVKFAIVQMVAENAKR